VGNPLIDGFETNEVDANLDLKSGVGFAHGKGSSGTGRGTGDLQGMSMAWESSGGLVFDNPCSSLPGVPVTGIITTPGGP
jgi:hypothetical protein